uniref:Uncharacterized protein n=1 Tax=Trypanosoma congolense (strain IL3000) TaxID=1068625 RepID=G0USF9_TRYCI|nr:conserved hypothetical protein [Trypanosoma congolense IL3000]
MAVKKQVKKQRVRMTNKAVEGLRFSTVRMPAKSETQRQTADIDRLLSERHSKSDGIEERGGRAVVERAAAVDPKEGLSSSSVFDPISSDPMFIVVEKSKYWPPPTLQELHASKGVEMSGDGFDPYDRRQDDQQARKERAKVVRGELNHPRGKPRKNMLVSLESSGSDAEQ